MIVRSKVGDRNRDRLNRYRLVGFDRPNREFVYARPWPVWAIMRLLNRVDLWKIGVLGRLYQKGLIHFASHDVHEITRLRNVRPGRSAE